MRRWRIGSPPRPMWSSVILPGRASRRGESTKSLRRGPTMWSSSRVTQARLDATPGCSTRPALPSSRSNSSTSSRKPATSKSSPPGQGASGPIERRARWLLLASSESRSHTRRRRGVASTAAPAGARRAAWGNGAARDAHAVFLVSGHQRQQTLEAAGALVDPVAEVTDGVPSVCGIPSS